MYKTKNTLIKHCFVPNCFNNSIRNMKKIFLTVPRKLEIRKKWCEAVGITTTNQLPRTNQLYCCEDHFDLKNDCENWIFYEMMGGIIKIKKNVVPKLKHKLRESTLNYDSPTKRRKIEETADLNPIPEQYNNSVDLLASPNILQESQSSASLVSDLSEYELSTSSRSEASTTSDDDKKKRFQELNLECTLYNIENKSRFYLGLPRSEYLLIKLTTKMAQLDYRNILIVLTKIRLNDPFTRMSDNFGLSVTTISEIFNKSILKMASLYQSLIYWPEKWLIKKTLPISFRARFNNVQSLIDCFEIEIQTPTNALHQAVTWSNYKKCNTIKYLISSSPNGTVNFISPGFGGRITDTEMIKNSGFLNIIPENCSVMADRGFKSIEGLLNFRNCKLLRPPSATAEQKFSEQQVMMSKRIASLRIHIERVIRRIREFNILAPHACVNAKFIKFLDYIVIIACALINLQGLLIK